MKNENIGAAERVVGTALAYGDHLVHNRPGMVSPDARSPFGLAWRPVTHREENGVKVVYGLVRQGKKTARIQIGTLGEVGKITDAAGREVGRYRAPGLVPEAVAWLYRQVAEVWKLDNEFAARWASHAFAQEHRDLKVVLAAFMLVQARKGDAVEEGGDVLFRDEDFRDVGEAMLLLRKEGRDFHPKLLLRVHDVLTLPAVAAVNRELGFGISGRRPFVGRWPRVTLKWLRHREENPKLLEGLVKAGFRRAVMSLARRVGYKPESPRFFEVLRWKQAQAEDGRRAIAIGVEIKAAETWAGKTEAEICEAIVRERPNYKRIVGLLPKEIGLTRAIAAAAVEASALSDKDLVVLTPTLEELGLLEVPFVRERWEKAARAAEDMRAANVARRVRSKETKEILRDAADAALKGAMAETTRGLRVYFAVDVSGSMQGAIEAAKGHVARFLQGFPAERLHVAIFNTTGRELRIPHASAAGVANAFRGIVAGGGTDYGAGVRALAGHAPAADEDALFVFVGDEEASVFAGAVRRSGLSPVAFGLVRVGAGKGSCVRDTAAELGIPCFAIDDRTFDDPYAIPRTVRALCAATPVSKAPAAARASLAEAILKTELLAKPAWAA